MTEPDTGNETVDHLIQEIETDAVAASEKAVHTLRALCEAYGAVHADRDALIEEFNSLLVLHGIIQDRAFAAGFKACQEEAQRQSALLARHQPCGCIICNCEDEERCHGCGSKHCGTHPLGEMPSPVYDRLHPQFLAGFKACQEEAQRVIKASNHPALKEHWCCSGFDVEGQVGCGCYGASIAAELAGFVYGLQPPKKEPYESN